MKEPDTRPLTMAPIPDGRRVRYCVGRWAADAMDLDRKRNDAWVTTPGASQRDGTTLPRAEAKDWGIFDVPLDANLVQFDGEDRPTWVKASVLDEIGFMPAPAKDGAQQMELTW